MDPARWQRKQERFNQRMEKFERRMDRFGERFERRWQRQHGYGAGRSLFAGMIFVTIGVVFLLGNMGFLNLSYVLRFWPVIVISVGVFKLVESGEDYARSSGIFWVVIGGLFLTGTLGILRVSFRDFWPVVLIGFGALMLWRSVLLGHPLKNSASRDSSRSAADRPSFTNADSEPVREEPAAGATAASSNSMISAMAILGGVERRNNCQDFRGGSITAIMGGCEIDLRTASIASSNEPILAVFALWGGIEVRVPPDWTVVSQVDPILGGFEDSTLPPKEASKRLILRGTAIMGGIEVSN